MNELVNERIILSTKKLFKTTFNRNIDAGKPYMIQTDSVDNWDTSGVVSITGSYSGLLAIRFKKELPETLLKEVEMSGLHSEMLDLMKDDMVGELTNIIAGNTFSGAGMGDILISIPVTIQGENHLLSWSREPHITVIPFSVAEHTFNVETELKEIEQ